MLAPNFTSFIAVVVLLFIKVLDCAALSALSLSGRKVSIMAGLLIQMAAKQKNQIRYQLAMMTNACPHYFCTRIRKRGLGELQSWGLSQYSKSRNKSPARQTSTSAVPKALFISNRELKKCPQLLICKRKTPSL